VAKNILTVDPSSGKRKRSAIDADYIRSNVFDIGSGVQVVTVVFSSAVPTDSYAAVVTLQRLGLTTPQFQPVTITEKTVNGFTFRMNADSEDASYKANYITMPLI
jgi:hypothetical protein